jgi:hypothetical protein
MVPTHLQAKRFCLERGCCLVGDSLASDFVFGLGDGFDFAFAVGATVGAGVGLSDAR